MNKWMFRKRELNVGSLSTDQYPFHISKGTNICQHNILYPMACDATYVIDNDNLATELSAQIQISMPIDMVKKLAVEPKVLAKRWGITYKEAQKTIQAKTKRKI